MSFNLSSWLIETSTGKCQVRPRLVCKDGFSISVQATEYAYCSPRENEGPWYQVECGFPSEKPDSLMEFAEQAEIPTETVYGYVPIHLVQQLLDSHGGLKP